jgi:hypothetical protein
VQGILSTFCVLADAAILSKVLLGEESAYLDKLQTVAFPFVAGTIIAFAAAAFYFTRSDRRCSSFMVISLLQSHAKPTVLQSVTTHGRSGRACCTLIRTSFGIHTSARPRLSLCRGKQFSAY